MIYTAHRTLFRW